MRWPEGFIGVDWGTTNRRAYLIDRDRACIAEFEDGKGIMSVEEGGFPAAVAEILARLEDKPLLMAGMIGSNRGWIEVPYVPCPAGPDDLVRALVWPTEDIAIIPGVSFLGNGRADVMRGEEVQILGAVATGLIPRDCLVCHPGTHNKWARVVDGRIVEFRTVMTGELFNLLGEHSILSDLLAVPVAVGEPFHAGARHGLAADDLASELFAVRARVLLDQAPREDAASYTSGLLIGADVRIGLKFARDNPIIIMGRPELTLLYAAALAEAGLDAIEHDGETSFLAGITHIAETIGEP